MMARRSRADRLRKHVAAVLVRRPVRAWKRLGKKRQMRISLIAASFVFAVMLVYTYTMPKPLPTTAYRPLLDTIAKGESKGNYNAYFGNVANTTVRFTDMSVADVMEWQAAYVAQGGKSSAVGKYQIIRSTLAGLVQQLGLSPDTRFDAETQDRMAIALLERRGALAFVDKQLSREAFAANLAKEWAALPRVVGEDPQNSYYAHDGLNKSQISIDEILHAVAALETQAATR
jgi:muramidase (phage lysozyme)